MRLNDEPRLRLGVSLTPLIDVVFLLLVFFMLASTFIRFSSVKIETASGGPVVAQRSNLTLVHVSAGARFTINGSPTPRETIQTRFADLIASGKTDAVVVMRKSAKVADLVTGLSIVRRAGFKSVRVVD